MPIKKIRLQQFKCFQDSGEIVLAPLTVIFGRNNSGKSSILQSLLLLRQTLDSPEYGPRLDLRGPIYPAGTYADIVHQHKSSENVVMSFEFTPQSPAGSATIDLEFASDEPQPPRLVRLSIRSENADRLEIRRGRGRGGPYELYIGGESQGTEREAIFRFPESGFFPLIGREPLRRGRPSTKREKTREFAQRTLRDFEATLRNVRALGPFRRHPDRRYEYSGRSPQTIDVSGRAVVDALIEDMTRRTRQRGELLHGVNQWLKAVGRVRISALKRISKSARIYEVRLRDADSRRWANFADVGFGIGQALPVFVEGLRTPPGGMFIVQEPEIHLHPDAQLQMADFLVSLARSNRWVIAETHSEHLLLRIRRRILGRRSSKLRLAPSDVSIIYVSKGKLGTSTAAALPVDDLAQIADWPKGFMEEATEERMAILHQMAGSPWQGG
jgi:predicted ATPase